MKSIKFGIGSEMKSATAEIEKQVFEKVQGKSSIWYVGVSDARADHVYRVTSNKEGMGGRDSNFLLDDGSTDVVAGVWKSNADSLLVDTELDLRDKFTISYVISKQIEHSKLSYGEDTFIDVLEYKQDIITSRGRSSERAIHFANKLGVGVHVSQKTSGGRQTKFQRPTDQGDSKS